MRRPDAGTLAVVAQPEGSAGRADDVLFRPVRGGNSYEETVGRLLQALRLGVVRPGERLPSGRELAARLGVSRVTLREAVGTLQSAGYLESRRGRYGGTFVLSMPPPSVPGRRGSNRAAARELEDVLSLRMVLESGAAESAAARSLSRSEREHLVACAAECAAAERADYRRLDSRLHLAVAEVVGSPSLTTAVADARSRLNELLELLPLLPPNIAHSDSQHALVVAAILGGDPAAARREMAEHLEGTAALLRGFLGAAR